MDLLLKFRCQDCEKEFIVSDEQVDSDCLFCPHCQEEIEIPDPIKSLGKFVVFVKLGPELEAKIKIKVSAEK